MMQQINLKYKTMIQKVISLHLQKEDRLFLKILQIKISKQRIQDKN